MTEDRLTLVKDRLVSCLGVEFNDIDALPDGEKLELAIALIISSQALVEGLGVRVLDDAMGVAATGCKERKLFMRPTAYSIAAHSLDCAARVLAGVYKDWYLKLSGRRRKVKNGPG